MMYEEETPTTLQQGCIVKSLFFYATGEDHVAVALSPACDFAQEKAEHALFVRLVPFDEFILRALAGSWSDVRPQDEGASPTTKQRKKLDGYMKKLMGGQWMRYHWFDCIGDEGPWVADFQVVSCVPQEQFGELELLAAMKPKFMEQLPARWAAYAGRIGVPDRPESDYASAFAIASSCAYGDSEGEPT